MIDQPYLDRQTAGDTALQGELLTLFLAQIRDVLDRPDVGGTAGDPRWSDADLPLVLHRLHGAASAVGAGALAAALRRAEADLDRDPPVRTVLETLRSELVGARDTLAVLIAARNPPGLAKAGESR